VNESRRIPHVLFVSNGHGEGAIAARLASELRTRGEFITDHLALVGEQHSSHGFNDVGPRLARPSGGLVAMGNVRAFSQDLRSGFAGLWFGQRAYLANQGHTYDRVVAVGDVYALLMSFFTRRPIVFVGTAKSLYVAPYGPFERRMLRRATDIFVRDAPTAAWLRERGVPALAPGNVIVDLLDVGAPLPAPDPPMLALFPGSRTSAYVDAVKLAAVARRVLARRKEYSAVLSVAPTLSVTEVMRLLSNDGWDVRSDDDIFAFRAHQDGIVLHGATGELAPLVRLASIVVGQAGTGNEAAAAAGVPVVALAAGKKLGWYRMRQGRLLGEALRVVLDDVESASQAILELIDSPELREHMSRVGRERMGGSGGAAAIAEIIAARAKERSPSSRCSIWEMT
jgi:uncharacterized protein (TIGR03492 family)